MEDNWAIREIKDTLLIIDRVQERLKKESRDTVTFRYLREERINLYEGNPVGYCPDIDPCLAANKGE